MIFKRLRRMIASWVGWSTGHPIVSACLFPPQHPDVCLAEEVGGSLRCSIVYYGGQLVVYYTGNGGLWRFTGSQLGYGSVSEGTGAAVRCRRG